jgi:hypothetical protein
MRGLGLFVVTAWAMLVVGARVTAADEELATIEGKVTYKGLPLPDGKISFHGADGQFVGARIKDAQFRVDRVPVGPVTVVIESKKVKIPAKFTSEETSGLTVEVKKGKATVDFDLSD